MNKKIRKSILATTAIAAMTSSFAVTILDETVPGIVKVSPGAGIADRWETSGNVDLGALFPAETDFVIPGLIYVKDGHTFSIPGGSIMRGQPREVAGVSDNPGALIITRGAKINAVGTATDPIIFTTAADTARLKWQPGDAFLDASPKTAPLPPRTGATNNTALWGGLVLLGKAPVNTAGASSALAGAGEDLIEGLPDIADSIYGGIDPNDNSGVLSYVSVRHNGDILTDGDEVQGITLGGVGYGTQIDHVEVYCSADDGIEIFGGTVFIKNFMISYYEDDGLDLDQGYTGVLQFGFILHPDNSAGIFVGGDECGEWDGDDGAGDFAGFPLQYQTMYNMTFLGNAGTNGQGIQMKAGFGGDVYNSLVVGFAARSLDDAGSGVIPPAARYAGGTLNIEGCTFFPGTAGAGIAAGIIADSAPISLGGAGNKTGDPVLKGDAQIGAQGLNPVPGFNINTVISTAGPGIGKPFTSTFVEPVSYKGAFENVDSTTLWTTGWTAMNMRGILVDRGDGVEVVAPF